jgi:hypothetical protein
MKIKLPLVHIFARLVYPDAVRIVVASNGRAGSTMLAYAISSSIITNKFGLQSNSMLNIFISKFIREVKPRISTINHYSAFVCKTHDLFDKPHFIKCKYIFVHGEPLESALSVEKMVLKEGSSWFKEHQYHLKASGSYDELFDKDVLNYEGQIKSWMSKKYNNDVLCIDYEELWDKVDAISKFLGFKVELPKKHNRISKEFPKKLNKQLFNDLNRIRNKYCEDNYQDVNDTALNHH